MFCKKCVLTNFTKFTGKRLCHSFFFNKVASPRPATLLKKRLWHRYFPVKFVRAPFFIEHNSRFLCSVLSVLVKENRNQRKRNTLLLRWKWLLNVDLSSYNMVMLKLFSVLVNNQMICSFYSLSTRQCLLLIKCVVVPWKIFRYVFQVFGDICMISIFWLFLQGCYQSELVHSKFVICYSFFIL